MNIERNDEIEGKMELPHACVSSYRTVFAVAIFIGVLYLGIILISTL